MAHEQSLSPPKKSLHFSANDILTFFSNVVYEREIKSRRLRFHNNFVAEYKMPNNNNFIQFHLQLISFSFVMQTI